MDIQSVLTHDIEDICPWPDEELLSFEHQAILGAMTSRIIPSDDGPGAREAEVMRYIPGALRDARHRGFLPLLQRGLDFVEYLAQNHCATRFIDCGPREQDRILHEAQNFPNNESRKFFETVVELSLEGFLCDPSRGGNRRKVGWEYMGFELDQPAECERAMPRVG